MSQTLPLAENTLILSNILRCKMMQDRRRAGAGITEVGDKT